MCSSVSLTMFSVSLMFLRIHSRLCAYYIETMSREINSRMQLCGVHLDHYTCDLNLEITKGGYSCCPFSHDGFSYMWAGCKATHGIRRGKICYEVKVTRYCDVLEKDVSDSHVVRVGWSTDSASLQLGEDKNSFGFGGTGKKSVNRKFLNYGRRFEKGDVIGCYLAMENGWVDISYSVNGRCCGSAFKVRWITDEALFPHVLTKNCELDINFGQATHPYFSLQPGYKLLGHVPPEFCVRAVQAPPSQHDCEVIMMVGLPGVGKTTWATNYAKIHPSKKYVVLGTDSIIDKMRIMGLPRKNNFGGRWDVLIKQATQCFNVLLKKASNLPKNLIIDQTNVYASARRRKVKQYREKGYMVNAMVLVPRDEDLRQRSKQRTLEEGKEVPEAAVLDMKANFSLPHQSENLFDRITFLELQQHEAQQLVEQYNMEALHRGHKSNQQKVVNSKRTLEDDHYYASQMITPSSIIQNESDNQPRIFKRQELSIDGPSEKYFKSDTTPEMPEQNFDTTPYFVPLNHNPIQKDDDVLGSLPVQRHKSSPNAQYYSDECSRKSTLAVAPFRHDVTTTNSTRNLTRANHQTSWSTGKSYIKNKPGISNDTEELCHPPYKRIDDVSVQGVSYEPNIEDNNFHHVERLSQYPSDHVMKTTKAFPSVDKKHEAWNMHSTSTESVVALHDNNSYSHQGHFGSDKSILKRGLSKLESPQQFFSQIPSHDTAPVVNSAKPSNHDVNMQYTKQMFSLDNEYGKETSYQKSWKKQSAIMQHDNYETFKEPGHFEIETEKCQFYTKSNVNKRSDSKGDIGKRIGFQEEYNDTSNPSLVEKSEMSQIQVRRSSLPNDMQFYNPNTTAAHYYAEGGDKNRGIDYDYENEGWEESEKPFLSRDQLDNMLTMESTFSDEPIMPPNNLFSGKMNCNNECLVVSNNSLNQIPNQKKYLRLKTTVDDPKIKTTSWPRPRLQSESTSQFTKSSPAKPTFEEQSDGKYRKFYPLLPTPQMQRCFPPKVEVKQACMDDFSPSDQADLSKNIHVFSPKDQHHLSEERKTLSQLSSADFNKLKASLACIRQSTASEQKLLHLPKQQQGNEVNKEVSTMEKKHPDKDVFLRGSRISSPISTNRGHRPDMSSTFQENRIALRAKNFPVRNRAVRPYPRNPSLYQPPPKVNRYG
ncbi:unnamed protein product [Clavelina lepadiformis]|uniref:B30.2/SPRY domain-containing protein n=1 Tax=Clavelina lepadiformis TaxID=159417 RepID=A0ABP0FBA7_CLALP